MRTIESSVATTTEERAYFIYLERQKQGVPGDEHSDWIQAEASAPARILALTEIKGIGPRVATQLNEIGVTTVEQLANWELSDFGEKLPRLTARAKSGKWIEQARELS